MKLSVPAARPAERTGALLLAAAGLLLAAAPASGAQPAGEARPLRVMSFNIEWGGAHVRFASVVDAIVAAEADVVGVQEPEGNLPRLARELDWHYDLRNHVISRFPLIDPPDAGGRYVLVEVRPGHAVAVANLHLPSDPYGESWLREGRPVAEVLALERRVRLPPVQPVLDVLPELLRQDLPVFLTGDFNSPSHQDWTKATVGRFPHRDRPIAWPVARAVHAAGFADAWRETHPDPAAQPGFTWWAARPRIEDYNPSDPTRQARIDFLWFAGPAEITGSRLVGEPGGPEVSIAIEPWPSDHRAVVGDFLVRPAPLPVLIAAERRVQRAGEALRIRYVNAGEGGHIVLVREQGGTPEKRYSLERRQGVRMLPAEDALPGRYRLLLADAGGRTVSRNILDIQARDAVPSVAVAGSRFGRGTALPVAWANAPGNRYDWIALFPAEAPPDAREGYAVWAYLGARSTGRMTLSAATVEEGWPPAAGRYVLRLLEDDGFRLLAQSVPFSID